jgi:hypothetical protein
MPLPKIPSKPATILLAKDYPKAEPGKSPVRAAAKAENDPVEDLISGQAVRPRPAARASRRPRCWPSRRRAKPRRRPPRRLRPSPAREDKNGKNGVSAKLRENRHERAASGQAQAGRGQRQVLGQPQGRQRRRVQDVRARHECADARPDLAVPLRGTRRLPADDDARGARQPQEGHVGSRPQRAPGIAHAGRPDREHRRRRDRSRHPAGQAGQQGCQGPPVLPDPPERRHPARRPPLGQGRQPDPGRGARAGSGPVGPRDRAGVEGHQHAHQGARPGPGRRGLLQRPRAGRYRPAVLGHRPAAGRLLDQARQEHGVLAGDQGRQLGDLSTASPVPSSLR